MSGFAAQAATAPPERFRETVLTGRRRARNPARVIAGVD